MMNKEDLSCRIVYAKCDSYDDDALLTEALEKVLAPQIAAFGSLKGKKIMFKPNLLVWKNKEEIASVDPRFLLAAAKIFIEKGAIVTIRETPAVQTALAVVKSMGIAEELEKMGIEVLYDDRGEKAGFMFSDADLLGIPLRIVVSPKTLEAGQVEFKRRNSRDSELLTLEEAARVAAAKVKEELAKFDI